MLRKTALTAVLVLTADITTTALAPAGGPTLTAAAAAADFDGRIKRIRIKRQRGGSGFKIVGRVEGSTGSTAESAEIEVRDAASSELLDTVTIDNPIRARVFFSTQLSEGNSTDPSTYKVYPQLAEEAGEDFAFDDEGYALDDEGEAIAGPYKIRARVTGEGELQVSITSEDRAWEPASIAGLQVADAEGELRELSLDGLRHTFRADLSEDTVIEGDVLIQASIYDGDGLLLDTFRQTSSVEADPAEPGFDQIQVKETRKGAVKLVSWTTSDGDAAALEVEMTDSATGETVLYTVDDTPILTERTYLSSAVAFDSGELPDGHTYLCLIDLIDSTGVPTGEQVEVEVVPPSVAEGEDYAVATVPFADGLGAVGFVHAGGGAYFLVGALWSDDAAQAESFNVIFEEPFDGPVPLETEVSLGLVGQLDKWVQKGDGAVPDGYTLTSTLTTAEGAVLESTTVVGGGSGTVYSGGVGLGTGKVVKIGDLDVNLDVGFRSDGTGQ